MSELASCDCCSQPMKLLNTTPITNKSYKLRRWYCELCDIRKSTFGSIEYDESILPMKAIRDIANEALKETENRL